MLTQKDLAILKAAMQFWDEEMSPHGIYAYQSYFKGGLPADLKQTDFKSLREKLRNCKLQYLQYDHLFETVHRTVLLDRLDQSALNRASDLIRIASVLTFDAEQSSNES